MCRKGAWAELTAKVTFMRSLTTQSAQIYIFYDSVHWILSEMPAFKRHLFPNVLVISNRMTNLIIIILNNSELAKKRIAFC